MGILLFKNGDSTFENGNSLDIFESKTNLPLCSQMNCRKCRINLLSFLRLKVKKNAFFVFLFNFQSTKKGYPKEQTIN